MLRPQARFTRPADGFALLVTIVLVAFLVLILVGLATFTRVETQVASNAQALAQARQNALFALNLSLGELQRHLGPDQRATARADLINSASPNPLWIGVWGNAAAPSADTPDAALLTWLVSGNERAAYDVTTAGADFGRIGTVTTAPTRAPSATYTDANSAVLLGAGTTARNTPAYATVRAPLVDIEVAANQLPGFAATDTTPTTVGRYAWWADDESQKARLDLEDPHAGANPAYSFGAAQRSAIELMATEPEPPAYGGTALGEAAFPRVNPNLAKILRPAQAAFAAPAAQQTTVRDALRARSSDFTVTGASVLADARRGGLKQDLTRILYDDTIGPANTDLLFAAPSDLPASSPDFAGPPAWGILRSYAALTASPLAARAQTHTRAGVHAVPVWAELGFSVGYDGASPAGTPKLHIFPRLVLWNPHDKPLDVPRLEFGMRGGGYIRLDGTPQLGVALATARLAGTGGGTAAYFRFIVEPLQIPAGRALLLTLSADGASYAAGTNTLVPADNRDFSAVITSTTPRAAPTQLTDFTSGENYFYLREASGSLPLAAVPAGNTPPAGEDMHKWAMRVGRAASGATTSLAINPALASTAPQFRLVSLARLANAHNHASGLQQRWIANAALAAPLALRAHTNSDYNTRSNLYQGHLIAGGDSLSPVLNINSSGPADVAIGSDYAIRPDGRLVLLATPRAERPLFSIADLRHAPLARIDTGPSYVLGNSLADFRVPRHLSSRPWETLGSTIPSPPFALMDASYLANQALWDSHYFSTVPSGLSAANPADPSLRLPQSRLRPRSGAVIADLTDHRRAAVALLFQGGFNVNSTSAQAWRAMLGALHGLPYDPVADAPGPALDRPFSRLPRPLAGSTDRWLGFRALTADQLDALAENIVAQSRARAASNSAGTAGPFIHLAEFVNRRLVERTAGDAAFGLKGALQAALDATDLEATPARRINAGAPYDSHSAASPDSAGSYDLEHLRGGTATVLPVASRNAFGPGHLTQGDLLAVIGPSLAVRGDTFTVRVYGEAVSPLDATEVLARAWAEAVVQRLPDYLQSADAAELPPSASTAADNRRFGRRFTVVSFRWLGPTDL